MNRHERKSVADETLTILERENYVNRAGRVVDLASQLRQMRDGTQLIRPAEIGELVERASGAPKRVDGAIEVVNETTFAGARSLLDDGAERVCCLNFASAMNPGGGWRNGSQAQEEALARASGLSSSLAGHMEYYDRNSENGPGLYLDYMIYSPDVPVFRDDADALIDQPWCTSVISAPAVNARVLQKQSPELMADIESVMRRRIDNVLALAVDHDHTHLVLGAWGCGVFRNKPTQVAAWFDDQLRNGPAGGAFSRVRFSVLDWTEEQQTITAFTRQFSS